MFGIDSGVLPKFETDRVALPVDGVYPYTNTQQLESSIVEQVADGPRRFAIAILQLRGNIGKLRLGFDASHTLVHSEPLVFLRNVLCRDAYVEAEIELGFGLVRSSLSLHLANGALEHLRVELKSNRLDVSALLAAQ